MTRKNASFVCRSSFIALPSGSLRSRIGALVPRTTLEDSTANYIIRVVKITPPLLLLVFIAGIRFFEPDSSLFPIRFPVADRCGFTLPLQETFLKRSLHPLYYIDIIENEPYRVLDPSAVNPIKRERVPIEGGKRNTWAHERSAEVDLPLVLKMGYEVVRMDFNLSRMKSNIRGCKQFVKAVEWGKSDFEVNDYEFVDILGKSCSKGLNALAFKPLEVNHISNYQTTSEPQAADDRGCTNRVSKICR